MNQGKKKPSARLSISGVFRCGRKFRFGHIVEAETEAEIGTRIQAIRNSIFAGVGRKNTYVIGVHVIDLEQVSSASIIRRGFGEMPIRIR
jgi:hypothetical protein